MNTTVTIRGQKYQMYQAPTGWVFVRSQKAGRTYDIGKVVDGAIVEIRQAEALRYVTNAELLEAWVRAH